MASRKGTRHGAQRRGGQTEGGLLLPTFLGWEKWASAERNRQQGTENHMKKQAN
jgi:hypothetical protein